MSIEQYESTSQELTKTLPPEVAVEDRRLDDAAATTEEELAHLRWHWTLDKSNPARVSFSEYGRAVGRSAGRISVMARGYAAYRDTPERVGGSPGRNPSLSEHIRIANSSYTRLRAAELLADAKGVTIKSVMRGASATELAVIIDDAQQAAERRGTTVDQELERTIEIKRKARIGSRNAAQRRKNRRDARYVEIEGDVAVALKRMKQVLELARTVALRDEHIELITDSIANLRALLNLIDLQLTGTTEIDWDTEMAKLNKKGGK